MESRRYAMLDSLRGLTLISMITYHTVWDMVYIFGENWNWYKTNGAYIWQQSICWCFILLSGFCWSFGRKKWKRGIIVFVGGAIVSLVTLIAMPENRVMFGVLTLLGSSMIFMMPLEKVLKRLNPYVGCAASFLLFLFFKNASMGYLGFGAWWRIRLPREWYRNLFTAYLGFPENGFYSADYFAIFPWLFLFIAGYYLHKIFIQNQWMDILRGGKCEILERFGKYSLIIYMLHQPLVYGVLTIIYGMS